MRGFDVLDPNLDVHKKHFIEASAGTGKTFAIENIVLRLLKEPHGPTIDQILVVTFTRKAAWELKTRIRKNIECALLEIHDNVVKKRLEEALFSFDDCKIFTIHGFCFYVLREYAFDTCFFLDERQENTSPKVCLNILKDFLRTELTEDLIHPTQLEKLLKLHLYDMNLFTSRLKQIVLQRLPIHAGRFYFQLKKEIKDEIEALKKHFSIDKEKLFYDLQKYAPCFGKLCDRQKNVKQDVKEGLLKAAHLFEHFHEDFFDLPILKMVEENMLKKTVKPDSLFYPDVLAEMQKKLIPLIAEASDAFLILGRLAESARLFLENVIDKEELVFFEDLILKMEKAVQDDKIAEKIRETFKAALIDEFQDTDPMQWKIFSKLFLDDSYRGSFILVGDPKQSIYHFRGADVYTYMEAKKDLGVEAQSCLTKNYRSDPALVHCLNILFSEDFLFLPKTKQKVECLSVSAAKPIELPLKDGRGSVHFTIAESEEELFAFVVDEIKKLHFEEGISLDECAVLVKDRYQEKRFLDCCPLPVAVEKHQNLVETAGFQILQDLLKAAIQPHDRSKIARALSGPLFNCDSHDFEEKIPIIHHLSHFLDSHGIFYFFNAVIQESRFCDENTYLQMLQIVELLAKNCESKEDLLPFLQTLKDQDSDAEDLKLRTYVGKNAVKVMTTHVSKGLEFSIVFPIGLSLTYSKKRDFVREGQTLVLTDCHEELEAEKMRQLYVAFTRAKKRLYVPLVKKEEGSIIHQFLKNKNIEGLCKEHADMTFSSCREHKNFSGSIQETAHVLHPPPPHSFFHIPSSIYSYSSLVKKNVIKKMEPHPGVLPSGKETGSLLHKVFEEISFDQITSLEVCNSYVAPLLKNTFLESWATHISEMVYHVLTMPLYAQKNTFTLRDIHPSKIRKEMEFLYPTDEPKGFCKGFVDLFFEHEGFYYSIDWKSNDLCGDYSHARMQKEMIDLQYDLQADLYAQALKKYLHIYDHEKLFVGSFYIFLRGPAFIFL